MYHQTDDEQRIDQIGTRMYWLMLEHPTYTEAQAQAVAETELALRDEMQQNDGEW